MLFDFLEDLDVDQSRINKLITPRNLKTGLDIPPSLDKSFDQGIGASVSPDLPSMSPELDYHGECVHDTRRPSPCRPLH
jgi:hypothetical protein